MKRGGGQSVVESGVIWRMKVLCTQDSNHWKYCGMFRK